MEGDIGFVLGLSNKEFLKGMEQVNGTITDLHKKIQETTNIAGKSFKTVALTAKETMTEASKSLNDQIESLRKQLVDVDLLLNKKQRVVVDRKTGDVKTELPTDQGTAALKQRRGVIAAELNKLEEQSSLQAQKAGEKYTGGFWGGFKGKWDYEAHHFWKSNTKLEGTFSEQFQRMGDSASGKMGWAFAQGLKTLSGVFAGAFAVSTIAEFVAASTEAFEKMESTAQKLKLAVGASGGLASAYKELWQQADKLEGTAAIPKDQIVNAETMALQMGMTTEQVRLAIPVVTDFAAATGQDLGSAFNTVIMGMKGNERAVRRWGVTLKEGATWSENLGNTLDVLKSKFEGQAEVLSESTAEGRARKIEVLQDKIKENTGGFFASLHKMWQESEITTLEIAAEGYSHRSEIMQKEYEQHKDKFDKQSQAVEPLLKEFDTLSGKTNKTAEEQARLQKVIQEIADILPQAASGWDQYGNATGINRGKLLSELQEERKKLAEENKNTRDTLEQEIKQGEERAKELQTALNTGKEKKLVTRKVGSDYITEYQYFTMSNEKIAETKDELQGLNEDLNTSKRRYIALGGTAKFTMSEVAKSQEESGIKAASVWEKYTIPQLKEYLKTLNDPNFKGNKQEAETQAEAVGERLKKLQEEQDQKNKDAAKKAIADAKAAEKEKYDDAVAALERQAAEKKKNGEDEAKVDIWLRDQKVLANEDYNKASIELSAKLRKKYGSIYEEYKSDYDNFQDALYASSTERINNELADQKKALEKSVQNLNDVFNSTKGDIQNTAIQMAAPTGLGGQGKSKEEVDKYVRDKNLEAEKKKFQDLLDLRGQDASKYKEYQAELTRIQNQELKNRADDQKADIEKHLKGFEDQAEKARKAQEPNKNKTDYQNKLSFDSASKSELNVYKGALSYLDNMKQAGLMTEEDYLEKYKDISKKIEDVQKKREENGLSNTKSFGQKMLDHADDIQNALGKISDAFGSIVGAQMEKLDHEMSKIQARIEERNTSISKLQDEIKQDEEKAAKGFANNLNRHKKQLASEQAARQKDLEDLKKVQQEKAKLQRAQMIADQLQTQVTFGLALAKIFEKGSEIGPWGAVAAIAVAAAAVGAFIAFLGKIKATKQEGFYKGGYTGDIPTTKEAGVVHGQEFVMTAEKTGRMRGLLDVMHGGGSIGIDELLSTLHAGGVRVKKDKVKEVSSQYDNLSVQRTFITNVNTSGIENRVDKLEGHLISIKNKLYEDKDEILLDGTRVVKRGHTTTIIRKQ